eukprot:g24575.t1
MMVVGSGGVTAGIWWRNVPVNNGIRWRPNSFHSKMSSRPASIPSEADKNIVRSAIIDLLESGRDDILSVQLGDQSNFASKLARLSFHDCVGPHGCDGCLNFASIPGNKGALTCPSISQTPKQKSVNPSPRYKNAITSTLPTQLGMREDSDGWMEGLSHHELTREALNPDNLPPTKSKISSRDRRISSGVRDSTQFFLSTRNVQVGTKPLRTPKLAKALTLTCYPSFNYQEEFPPTRTHLAHEMSLFDLESGKPPQVRGCLDRLKIVFCFLAFVLLSSSFVLVYYLKRGGTYYELEDYWKNGCQIKREGEYELPPYYDKTTDVYFTNVFAKFSNVDGKTYHEAAATLSRWANTDRDIYIRYQVIKGEVEIDYRIKHFGDSSEFGRGSFDEAKVLEISYQVYFSDDNLKQYGCVFSDISEPFQIWNQASKNWSFESELDAQSSVFEIPPEACSMLDTTNSEGAFETNVTDFLRLEFEGSYEQEIVNYLQSDAEYLFGPYLCAKAGKADPFVAFSLLMGQVALLSGLGKTVARKCCKSVYKKHKTLQAKQEISMGAVLAEGSVQDVTMTTASSRQVLPVNADQSSLGGGAPSVEPAVPEIRFLLEFRRRQKLSLLALYMLSRPL